MTMDGQDNLRRTAEYKIPPGDLQFLAELNTKLGGFEAGLAGGENRPAGAPIVLIGGVQRSGTTLLYQLLPKFADVFYINNLVARFFRCPLVGIRLSQVLLGRSIVPKDVSSDYGVTPGLDGPHEFGYFWTEWLKLNEAKTHFLTDDEAAGVDWNGLRKCLRDMAAISEKPLLFKNPIAAFNAVRLLPLLPELRIVLVERDPFFVIQSTYLARKKRYGDADHWWSLKPPTFGTLRLEPDPITQVVGQVFDSMREFNRLLSTAPDRCVPVRYDELRTNPSQCVASLIRTLGLEVKSDAPQMLSAADFPDGDRVKVEPAVESAIRDAMARWLSRNGDDSTFQAAA